MSIGTLGTVISAIDMLRELLEKSGVDRSKAAQIAGEFISRLKPKGGTGGSSAPAAEGSPAFVEESWEYTVLTLAYHKPYKGTKALVVKLRDGSPISEGEPKELAMLLNKAVDDGWEILTSLGGEEAPTLILRREKR